MDKEIGSTSRHQLNFGRVDNVSNSCLEKGQNIIDELVNLEDERTDLKDDRGKILGHKIPKIGMQFEDEEPAFQFYNECGRSMGFSVRKNKFHPYKFGNIVDMIFFCSCQRKRATDRRDVNVKNHCHETRTSCIAQVKLNARYTSKLTIVEFNDEHKGHILMSSRKIYLLRSRRKITHMQALQVNNVEKSGIAPKAGLDFMAQDAGGCENLGFTLEDLKNYLHSKQTMEMKEGEVGAIFSYLQKKESDDPNFFYDVQVDKDDLIANIFWVDSHMRTHFAYFGDVMSFNITYKKNKYGRPFALFVGVNHHRKSTVFGAALLYDETIESFMWLLMLSQKLCTKKCM